MRHVILLDEKITTKEYDDWILEDTKFFEKHFGIEPKYWMIRKDFSSFPTYIDSDGDVRPTYNYLQSLALDVHKSYGDYGTDFVIMAVHEDNWPSDPPGKKGIWGTNYSNIWKGYHLQYARWDRDNAANTFGTMYHERAHSFDALVKTELGKDINAVAGTTRWDAEMVHGGSVKFSYIRWKENTHALYAIAPLMRDAFVSRLRLHISDISDRISLWQKLLRKLAELRNRKNGVPRE